MKKYVALFCALCLLLPCGCGARASSDILEGYKSVRRTVFGGGIVFTASVRGGDETGALKSMSDALDALDAEINVSSEKSALFAFNAMGQNEPYTPDYVGERVPVTKVTYDLVQKALVLSEQTGGRFTVAALPLVKLWHVDTAGLNAYAYADASQTPAPPTEAEIQDVLPVCDAAYLICGERDGVYYLQKTHPALQIDLGGIAKGYAADLCIQIAKAHNVTSALIDIGGNIALLGQWYKPNEKAYGHWNIGVTSPRPAFTNGGTVCALGVSADMSLVTSGDYERYYTALSGGGQVRVPHIVNVQTGLPLGVERTADGTYANARDYVVSATVLSGDSAAADAYATAVCLMGADEGARFLAERGVRGILLTADGKMKLVGVAEEGSGEAYFALTDTYGGYRHYELVP